MEYTRDPLTPGEIAPSLRNLFPNLAGPGIQATSSWRPDAQAEVGVRAGKDSRSNPVVRAGWGAGNGPVTYNALSTIKGLPILEALV